MPKRHKKRRQKRNLHSTDTEVALDSYANSSVKRSVVHTRVKKGAAYAMNKEANAMKGTLSSMVLTDELSWEDKCLDDFDFDIQIRDGIEENAQTDLEITVPVQSRRRKKQTPNNEEGTKQTYPSDLWFVISHHIWPEDIRTFAALCRDANAVVHTASFWKSFYKRFYDSNIQLPEILTPSTMERLHGLRARVIRSLFYLYPPLAERTKQVTMFQNEPHCLVGKKCMLVWYEKEKNMWNFNFKFGYHSSHPSPSVGYIMALDPNKRIDFIDGYKDIFHNAEDNCSILQANCKNFIFVPVVMGMFLNSVCLNVSREMRYHRLKLVFDTKPMRKISSVSSVSEIIVDLDPVVNLKVFHWWDPNYSRP